MKIAQTATLTDVCKLWACIQNNVFERLIIFGLKLIAGCLRSSDRYFKHGQDDNKSTIKTIGRYCDKGQTGIISGKFRLPLGNQGEMNRKRNYALQQSTYCPSKS